MVLTDVLADARTLPRAEQLRLIQELAAALLQDEATPIIESGREYPVWSPDAAYGAAETLLRSLDVRQKQYRTHSLTLGALKNTRRKAQLL